MSANKTQVPNFRIDQAYWMGATDSASEGVFRWKSDNAVMAIGTTIVESVVGLWAFEPNGGTGEQCIVFWSWSYVLIADWPCQEINAGGFICEHPSIHFITQSLHRLLFI